MNDIRSQIEKVAKAVAAPVTAPEAKRRTIPKARANDIAGRPRRDKQRRQESEVAPGLKESRFWLRFTTGKTVDYRVCPKRIQAHGHWIQIDEDNSRPNCICKCGQPESGEINV